MSPYVGHSLREFRCEYKGHVNYVICYSCREAVNIFCVSNKVPAGERINVSVTKDYKAESPYYGKEKATRKEKEGC